MCKDYESMNTSPLVSVIIPVFNTEKYLLQCVNSVLNQTYNLLEIILVDDGSTDQSGMICDEYAVLDNRIKVIHKVNGGQSSARNAALDISSGKYIYFLDSDDYIGCNLLEKLVETAEETNADIVFFEAQSFLDCNSTLNKQLYNKFDYKRNRQYMPSNGQQQYINLMKNSDYYVCTPLHFYRRSYLNDNGIRFEEGIIHEDSLFSAAVYLYDGLAAHLFYNAYYRRLRNQSTMTLWDRKQRLFRFNSLVTVYYRITNIIKCTKPQEEVIHLLITDSINAVLYAFDNLDAQDKQTSKRVLLRMKRHALFHYGKYDYELARKCSGVLSRPLIRGIHYLKSKIR